MANKLDLFAVLSKLDINDFGVYETLCGDEQVRKEFEQNIGWLLPQWMVGANSEDDMEEILIRFNLYCNGGWFSFRKHPGLQAKLLACCGTGERVRHKFFKPKADKSLVKIRTLLALKYPDIRDMEVLLWCESNSSKELKKMAEMHGYQKDDVKSILTSYARVVKI